MRPGEPLVFQLFNGPEFALTWLAAMRLGAVATPINFRLSAGETAHVLADSAPAAFIYDAELAAIAAEALERSSHAPAWTAVVGAGAGSRGDALDFAELLAASAEPPPAPPGDAYVETTRLYTSGTTGMPKGVSLNDLVEVMSAHDVVMHFPLSPDDRTLNMTPWFHRGGLYSGGPNPVFYVGAEAVSLRAFDPAAVLDLVAARELTFLVGAPTNLAMLAAEQRRQPRDLDSLRGIVTMGAPLEREACLLYQELLTPRIFNGYGTTESFWNTFLRPADLPAHAGSAGRACTDDDVVVARSDGESGRRPRRPGRRATARRSARSSSAPRRRATPTSTIPRSRRRASATAGSTAATSRPGTREGFVTIVGRGDDMLISGGENVHPVQVEEVLNEHPLVADSCVVGAARRALGRADRRLRGGGGGRGEGPTRGRQAAPRAPSTSPPSTPTAARTRCSPTTSAPAPTASSTPCR